MKIQIVKNRYVNSLLLLMLLSAAIHMLILFFIAASTADFYFLNYFNIISISYFIPNFLNSLWGDIGATLFAAVIYLLIFFFNA